MKAEPKINLATSSDDVKIAYSVSGSGPVMVKVANWMSHIEHEWHNPVWRHWCEDLSKHHTLLRYDQRGCGLSEQVSAESSIESWVDDLAAVVDAMGLKRFPLLGASHGGAVAVAYAARHPERVSHLVLCGAYARGRIVRDSSAESLDEAAILSEVIKHGWEKQQHTYRQVFSSQLIPDACADQFQAFNELQRLSCSTHTALQFLKNINQIDVLKLASQVKCPTLVAHARGDLWASFEEGRLLAAHIPTAQFMPLETNNHILLAEPMWGVFVSQLNEFLKAHVDYLTRNQQLAKLTPRERQVLDDIARGLSNTNISERLKLNEKTVRNHITHIFNKMGAKTRAEAIVMARESGMGKP